MRIVDARVGWIAPLILLAGLPRPAESSAMASIMGYQTTGEVDSTGVTGSPVISFDGMNASLLTTGSAFELGHFVVSASPGGSPTTYDDTPFTIDFVPRSIDGTSLLGAPPIVLHGLISGTIGGDGSGKASFWFDRLALPPEESPAIASYVEPFRTGNLLNTIFDAPGASTSLPSSSTGGFATIQAVIQSRQVPSPAPEPGAVVVLGVGLAAMAFRRLRPRSSGG